MEFSVTDSAGRKVAVKARNWLFAIASGLRALEVDANTLTSLTCNYEPDGSIVVEAPGNRRWWVKSLVAPTQLPFDMGAPPPPLASVPPPLASSSTPTPPVGDTRVAAPPERRVDASGPNPRRNSKPPHSPTPLLERAVAPSAQPISFEDEDAMATERKPADEPDPAEVTERTDVQALVEPPGFAEALEELAADEALEAFEADESESYDLDEDEDELDADEHEEEDPGKGVGLSVLTGRSVRAERPVPQSSQPPPTPVTPQRMVPPQGEPGSLTAPRRVEQDIRVVVSARSRLLDEDDSLWEETVDEDHTPDNVVADLSVPAPALEMPRSSLIREDPETLAERLFEASMDFIGAEPAEACQIALELVTEFVPCEAASIAIGTLNDSELTYVASNGPVAQKIQGRRQPFGKGLVGMCFDMRSTLVVTDVKASTYHDEAFDDATGFDTLAALCVPILDDEGLAYGVIQLLNPTDRPFFDEDEEAVETIARALAGALAFS